MKWKIVLGMKACQFILISYVDLNLFCYKLIFTETPKSSNNENSNDKNKTITVIY